MKADNPSLQLQLQNKNWQNNAQYDGISVINHTNILQIQNNLITQGIMRYNYHIMHNGNIIKYSWSQFQLYDSTGKCIKQNSSQFGFQNVQSCNSLSNNEVIVLGSYDANTFYLAQWNIQTNQIIKIKISYEKQQKDYFGIYSFIFNKSQLVCLIKYYYGPQAQLGVRNIKYYSYPFKSENDKPVYEQQNSAIFRNLQGMGTKINQYSSIMFITRSKMHRQKNEKSVSVLCIIQKQNKYQHQIRQIICKFPQKYNIQIFDVQLKQVWQPLQNIYYLNFSLNLNNHKLSQKLAQQIIQTRAKNKKINSGQKKQMLENRRQFKATNEEYQWACQKFAQQQKKQNNYHYILDYKNNKMTQLQLKTSKQQMDQQGQTARNKVVQFTNGFRSTMMQCYNKRISQNMVLNPYEMRKPTPRSYVLNDIYYVDTEKWQVVQIHKHSSSLYMYQNDEYNNHIWQYQNIKTMHQIHIKTLANNSIRIQVNTARIRQLSYCSSTITSFMMCQLIQNIDDDLICHTLDLIQPS